MSVILQFPNYFLAYASFYEYKYVILLVALLTDDALCKLTRTDRRRVCTAVFNSEYFADRIPISGAGKFWGRCEMKTVSFQTECGKTEAAGRTFREWMLSCRSSEDKKHFPYLLSQAYQRDQIFVYFQQDNTGDMFLESMSTNVRLTADHVPPFLQYGIAAQSTNYYDHSRFFTLLNE